MDLATVKTGLAADGVPADVAAELIEAYQEAKRRYHLGDHRPQEVEGGRFSEAAMRVLQHEAGMPVTPLGQTLPSVDQLVNRLENATQCDDSVRFHIPRILKVVYNIRNKRDVAHLGDGIDPNLQDATLVVACIDWVLAELVRLHHGVSADEAQRIIEDLVRREVPAVQEIDGHPVILSKLQPRDQALLMLYRCGADGASLQDLAGWLRIAGNRRGDLKKRLLRLDNENLVLHHPTSERFHITALGQRDVEDRGLAQPA